MAKTKPKPEKKKADTKTIEVTIPVEVTLDPDRPRMFMRRELLSGETAGVTAEACIAVVPGQALDVPLGTLVFSATIKGKNRQATADVAHILQALVSRWGEEIDQEQSKT